MNANPKRPGDDSNAAPVKTHDGNTSGGKGEAPKDMATGNVNVTGNINATGNITLDGNLTFGDAGDDSTQIVDTVTIDGEIDSNILPSANNTYNLGSSDNRWNSMFAETVNPTTIIAETYNLANYNTETRTGNSIYVATKCDDTKQVCTKFHIFNI